MVCPKISIVTPVFNQVRYIEETIKSILDQGYPNLEYIIIDGGSTDGTVDIIKKYESQLAYWVSEPDHGLYDALQKGFDHSTGDIMAWLNADDLYVNGCLKNVANVFENHKEINWLTGTHTHCDSNGNILYNWPGRRFCKYHFLMRDYQWIGQENTFWRRSLWERAGSRLAVEMRLAGDFELWLRFFNYEPLYYVKTSFGVYRRREGQLSAEMDKYTEEVDEVYSCLDISAEDQKTIDTYRRKKKRALAMNKLRFVNGEKMVRMRSFEKKHFFVPQLLAWNNEIQGFGFVDE